MKIFFPPDLCDECGMQYQPKRGTQRFCCAPCRKQFNERRISGGLQLYDLAMQWRIERPEDAWHNLTQLADQLATEERIIRKKRKDRIIQQKCERKVA